VLRSVEPRISYRHHGTLRQSPCTMVATDTTRSRVDRDPPACSGIAGSGNRGRTNGVALLAYEHSFLVSGMSGRRFESSSFSSPTMSRVAPSCHTTCLP